MCDNNGLTGIFEVDFQIIIDLWFVENYRQAIITTLNLYNTCHYFRNLLDEPSYFLQFQNTIGYKFFDRFADIDSLDRLINSLPMRSKNDNNESIKLVRGNVVSISYLDQKKNYRIIEASDSYARMIEIDIKGMIVDSKIFEIFSEICHWSRNDKPFVSQNWISPGHGCYINTDFIIWKAPDGSLLPTESIGHDYIRSWWDC
jgi:hypothetical protein